MRARIITIGDEILVGQIVDTNSAWLAREMNALGIVLDSIWSVSDTSEAIHDALDRSVNRFELVILTGGLGPTRDDITKDALEQWFGGGWKTDAEVLARVEGHFERRGVAMPAINALQAKLPALCTVLHNDLGTAAGMWFEKGKTIFISLPGVPYEMKHIFTERVVPRFKALGSLPAIAHRTIMTQGIGESSLVELIQFWEDTLDEKGIHIAYLPSPGSVRIRLSIYDGSSDALERLDREVREVIPLISDYVFAFDDEPIASAVGKLLLRNGRTIATAESCTGGYIAHLITQVSGSSRYFKGSVVAYANEVKVDQLRVRAESIQAHGAVSEDVAVQMAEGVRATLGCDYAVATTGIAGPEGGTPEKPVGTVWFAIATPEGTTTLCMRMGADRQRNIERSAMQALQLVRKQIMACEKISIEEALFF